MRHPSFPASCSGCHFKGRLIPLRIGERLGTAIGGTIGAFIGYCAFGRWDRYPFPEPGRCRGLVAGLMTGATTGNQIGRIIDLHMIRAWRCPRCKKVIFN